MHSKLALIPAAALLLGGGIAFAQSADEVPLASPLTFDEAIAIALEQQPGTIDEVALERSDDGKVVIELEVVTEDGKEAEFTLDAQTGEILTSQIDDDPTNDPGQEEETE